MQTDKIQTLNSNYAIGEQITFAAGPGGLVVAEIRNTHAAATVALQGGHVIAFQPHGHAPVLWVSSQSAYAIGVAIRGGIPICWPWFGPHPTDPTKPAHGFARTAMWSVRGTGVGPDDATQLRLGIGDDEATRTLWPHAFDLELAIAVGPALQVELVARNTGTAAFTCGSALHSYFGVSEVTAIAIDGLDGCAYIDKVAGGARKIQYGPVTIDSETDRIYLDTSAACTIADPGMGREIRVAKGGSRSTVVWNPWVAKARSLPDFGDEEYHQMVCVETTNAADDVVALAPGQEHRLRAVIEVRSGHSADA